MKQNYKKFIPCIYLSGSVAVRSFSDRTVISMNPGELAKFYSDNHADEIFVFDLSTEDGEHEANLDKVKQICSASEVPVTGAGNVRRMEDIKKLLYAGCKRAALNYSKPGNVELTQEVSLKFGRDKIAACVIGTEEVSGNLSLLEKYVSEIILIDRRITKECAAMTSVPVITSLPEISLEKILEVLSIPGVGGITGQIVNDNIKEIGALKSLCADNGIPVHTFETACSWEAFKKNSDGMVPVVVQDYKTDEVLMVAYMNEEAYQHTLLTGKMTYYSRSRKQLWIKGETSGHYQYAKSLTADCDMDTILAKVSQTGAACHTGSRSCFFNELMKTDYKETNPLKVFEEVLSVIRDRKVHPKEGSYTNYLFDKGIDKILKKLGEEATEIVIAAKNPNPNEIKYEISDFLYHMMVLMVEKGISWEEITEELSNR